MFEQFQMMFQTVMSVAALVSALPAFMSSQVPIGKDAAYGALMLAIGGVSAAIVRMLVGGLLREAASNWRMPANTAGIAGLMIMALIAPDELLLGVGISGAVIYVLLETLIPHRITTEAGIESTADRSRSAQPLPIPHAGVQPAAVAPTAVAPSDLDPEMPAAEPPVPLSHPDVRRSKAA